MTNSEFLKVLQRLNKVLRKQSLIYCERIQDAQTLIVAIMEKIDCDDMSDRAIKSPVDGNNP